MRDSLSVSRLPPAFRLLCKHDLNRHSLCPPESLFCLRSLQYQNGTLAEAGDRLAARARLLAAEGGPTSLIIPVNGQVFVLARQQPELARILMQAEEGVLDGISVWGAARLLGRRHAMRHQGVDLMLALCKSLNASASRVLLLGGRPGSAEQAKARLNASCCPGLEIETCCPPVGFEHSPEELAEVKRCIEDFGPCIVFVALGAPKQEIFMDSYLRVWNVPVAMAVGGSFEMIGGSIARAPRWMRTAGLEWLFRLLLEPRRLARRYFVSNTVFLWALLRELFTSCSPTSPS